MKKVGLPPTDVQSEASAPRTLDAGALADIMVSMNKDEADSVLNAAREGQPIDPLLITAALWFSGDLS